MQGADQTGLRGENSPLMMHRPAMHYPRPWRVIAGDCLLPTHRSGRVIKGNPLHLLRSRSPLFVSSLKYLPFECSRQKPSSKTTPQCAFLAGLQHSVSCWQVENRLRRGLRRGTRSSTPEIPSLLWLLPCGAKLLPRNNQPLSHPHKATVLQRAQSSAVSSHTSSASSSTSVCTDTHREVWAGGLIT